MDRRTQLKQVFEDTQRFYTENEALARAVEESRAATWLYEADAYPPLPIMGTEEGLLQIADNSDGSLSAQAGAWQNAMRIREGAARCDYKAGEITVTQSRTFEAAMRLHRLYPDKKIAVLNFASAIRPGGGVKNGSTAQEECLCRCSTLYPTLDRRWLWQKYYDVNRAAKNVVHTDACIYSPGVIIYKTDESIPKRLPESDWVKVDVISCAAPNLSDEPANWHNPETGAPVKMDSMRLFETHMKRAEHIMAVAAANGADILILGAFGCGAFMNDPLYVAKAYHGAVITYRYRFDLVEFAIYCSTTETENYRAFAEEMRVFS